MAAYCRTCGLSDFRSSRFRFQMRDLSRLLFLRLPVRCVNCDERAYTSLRHFLKLRRERKARHSKHSATV